MRAVEFLPPGSSLERAATVLRETGFDMAPVPNGRGIAGVVTQNSLASALGRGCSPYDSVDVALDYRYDTIGAYETGAEALRKLNDTGRSSLLVKDSVGNVIGIIAAGDLYPKRVPQPRPPLVGGMATPFGVYLTTGAFGAGVPRWALATTGAVMFGLFALGSLIAEWGYEAADKAGYAARFGSAWELLPMAILFIGMRLLPLSGIHAAEHKVVHAIERGEELVPEIVARMPRVHPRCGTNLWAGATIFLGIFSLSWPAEPDLRLIIAALATFLFWRPVGSLMQALVTTRPPNAKQIEMGIRSGKELLDKYRTLRGPMPNPFQRIWNSGMIHVLLGFAICEGAARGVEALTHWNLPF